jgi:hypothetical protein
MGPDFFGMISTLSRSSNEKANKEGVPPIKDREPELGFLGRSICSHHGASFGPLKARYDNTTGSMISILPPFNNKEAIATHFITGSTSPCLSLFKPVWIDAFPDFGPSPLDYYDGKSYWWRCEAIQRSVMADYDRRSRLVNLHQLDFETDVREKAVALGARGLKSQKERKKFTDQCMSDALKRLSEFESRIPLMELEDGTPLLFTMTARYWNRNARLSVKYKVNDYWLYLIVLLMLLFVLYRLYLRWY